MTVPSLRASRSKFTRNAVAMKYECLAMTLLRTALVAACFSPAVAVEFEAETADGRKLAGVAESLDAEKLALRTSDGTVSLPTAELMILRQVKPSARPDGAPAVWIDLVDGSKMVAVEWTLDGTDSRATLLDGQKIEVPRRAIACIRFSPADAAVAEQWTRLLQTKHDGDVVIVRKDDHLDFLRGVVRGATDESVAFEMDGEVLPIRRAKLFGVILLRPAGRELPAAIGRLTDAHGSEWSVESIALSEQFQWTTPAGVTVSQPVAAVQNIDFSTGKVAYLADVEPQSVNWQAFFPMDTELASRREFFRPRRNRGFESDQLELGGVRYTRGLVLHSRSEIVYRLPDAGTRLRATAGIADRVRPHGNVLLVIRGDGKTLYEGTLTGTDPPVELDLDVAGVQRLSILCDFGEGMDIADQLNLCNLRVVK